MIEQKSTDLKIDKEFKWKFLCTEDIQMTKKYMKRCSTLLIFREAKFKTLMRCCFTFMAIIQTQNSSNPTTADTKPNKYWQGCEKPKRSCLAGGNVKWYML